MAETQKEFESMWCGNISGGSSFSNSFYCPDCIIKHAGMFQGFPNLFLIVGETSDCKIRIESVEGDCG